MERLELAGRADVPGSGVKEEAPAGPLQTPDSKTGTADHDYSSYWS
jgi:hypothetical protein